MLDAKLKPRLFAYMAGIIKELDGHVIRINGPSDHVHLLTTFPANLALADFMRVIKTNSSGWVHEKFPQHEYFVN
jgi:putative transposase